MRKITVPLLAAAYLCLALTVGVLLWRSGGGWGAGLAGLIGALGLAFALHGLIARSLDHAALSADIGAVREANLILVRQIEQMQGAIQGLGVSVSEDSARRSEELTSEVRMLEDLIQRMSESIEERLASRPIEIASVVRSDDFYDRQSVPIGTSVRTRPCCRRSGRRWRTIASICICSRSSACLSAARCSTKVFPACATRPAAPSCPRNICRWPSRWGWSARSTTSCCSAASRSSAASPSRIVRWASSATSRWPPGRRDLLPSVHRLSGQNRDTAGGLIFELGQAAFEARGAVEARNMAKLADMGFRFSLDKLTDLAVDFTDLSRADVKFLKISGEVLLEQLLEADGRLALKSTRDIEAADFTAFSRRYGVEVIAEKIESERQVVDILELDVAFGQGNLFGEPRAIREAILAESDPPADFIRSTLARKAANW